MDLETYRKKFKKYCEIVGAQIQLQIFFDLIVRRCKILANLFVVVRVNNQNRNQKQLVASHNGMKYTLTLWLTRIRFM